jgi:hypothetical protein
MKSCEALQQELVAEFGPYVPLSRVWRQLSLPSLDAARGTAPVACLTLPGRRGWFIKAADIARWMTDALRPASSAVLPEQPHTTSVK